MPRCVRNFWLDAQIDGRRSRFASGPRPKDGGFTLDIYMRDRGSVPEEPLRVHGQCRDGRLSVIVQDGGNDVFTKETCR